MCCYINSCWFRWRRFTNLDFSVQRSEQHEASPALRQSVFGAVHNPVGHVVAKPPQSRYKVVEDLVLRHRRNVLHRDDVGPHRLHQPREVVEKTPTLGPLRLVPVRVARKRLARGAARKYSGRRRPEPRADLRGLQLRHVASVESRSSVVRLVGVAARFIEIDPCGNGQSRRLTIVMQLPRSLYRTSVM